MSLPIAFTPTPHQVGTDGPFGADAEVAFGDVADTTEANFEKINTYLRATTPTFAQTLMSGTFPVSGTPAVTNAWTAFDGSKWPALTINLPPRPHGLLIGQGIFMEQLTGDGRWIGVSWKATGGTTYDSNLNSKVTLVAWGHVGTTRFNAIPASQLTPGGQVTITPWYMVNSTTDGSNLFMGYGCLLAIAFAA